MTKQKTTKKALLASLLSLMLCCVMLIGTTFAWFTDSVSSKNNVIKSGNLKVELEYSKDMKEGSWKTVEGADDLFMKDALWEPGHAEVIYLRVSNQGNLALKYRFALNVISETKGINKDGKTFKLSDYLEYGVIKDVTEAYGKRADAIAAVTTPGKLTDYSHEGDIRVGEPAETVALVVYMPTTVGNEANHNGTVPSINLGVNLVATQLEAESDSFGKDYDATATYLPVWDGISKSAPELKDGVYHVTSAAELAYINTLLEEKAGEDRGIKVVLDADIDLGNHAWAPIGTEQKPFRGSFDGQGHTVYNVKVVEDANAGDNGDAGFFGVAQQFSAIKNLTLENVSVEIEGCERIGAVVGKTLFVDIINCHVINATLSGHSKIGAIAGDVVSADVVDCTAENVTVQGTERVGGLVGRTRNEGGSVAIVDNSIKNATIVAAEQVDYFVGQNVVNADLSTNKWEEVTLASDLYKYDGISYITSVDEKTVYVNGTSEGQTWRNVVENNTTVEAVVVGEGVTTIGNRTFKNCSNLKTVVLPSTLTTIDSGAFQSCTSLESIEIPKSVTTIGENAFYGCTNLKSINIPEGVTRIEKSAFREIAVTELTIPTTVTFIGDYAFRDNYSMEKVTILSESITSVGSGAFLKSSGTFPDVTIYVENEAVKDVITSSTSTYDFVTIEVK